MRFIRTFSPVRNYHRADSATLIYSGNDYFNTLIKLIESAQKSIHFQIYIFEQDETGTQVITALKQAAKRGVCIHLILDAFGSNGLSKKFIDDILNAGIQLRFFAPLFSKNILHFGRRLHHKVVVIDDSKALIGGINISDKYKGSLEEIPWLDYAILISGTVCLYAAKICLDIFNKKFTLKKKNKPSAISTKNDCLIRFQQNDRLRGKNQIASSYIHAIRNAKHSIKFVSSYFLPGRRILKALKKAAARGVKIVVIFSGISDVPLLGRATTHLYKSLLKENILIYEWKKSVLHGKLALVDNDWLTIGSFNLNHLSALGSIELNVDVIDELVTQELSKHLLLIINTGCDKIDSENYAKRNTGLTIFLNTISYYLVRSFIKGLALFPNLFQFHRKNEPKD
ncbi:MAG: phospholipase D-like domain-containing protein [Bacteroidia bacterium]